MASPLQYEKELSLVGNLVAARREARAQEEREIRGDIQKAAAKLQRDIDQGNAHIAFAVAIIFAVIKDSLDLFAAFFAAVGNAIGAALTAAGIPAIIVSLGGTVFLYFLKYLLIIGIWMIMFAHGWLKIRKNGRVIFYLATTLEIIPGLDFIPLETLAVLYVRHTVKRQARRAERKLAKLTRNATKRDLTEIEDEFNPL